MYGPSARLREERTAARRNNAGGVIATILSLLVVAAAVAVVAYLVLRTPSTAVDSAERLDPVGTALPAPTDPPTLPTAIPTTEAPVEAEPTALGFSGEQPAVAGLPTVAVPAEEAGPTPTPRLIAQPTDVPPTPIPPAPTLPPSVPITEVPVVALQPVEAAPPPAPTAQAVSQPTPVPTAVDDDPFNIFDDQGDSRIVPVVDDPLERVRAMQDEQRNNGSDEEPAAKSNKKRRDDPVVIPAVDVPEIEMPTVITGSGGNGNDPNVVAAPDVDAMIDEITARATDPNRNPNVSNGGRKVSGAADDDDDGKTSTPSSKKRKSARDKARERSIGRGGVTVPTVPSIVPNGGNNQGQNGDNDSGVCTDPTAPGFPFDC